MKSKHTPGPWHVMASCSTHTITGYYIDEAHDVDEGSPEAKANAALIAAAPRLLECLRELASRCAKIPAKQKSVGFRDEIQIAFEAIAEAES